MQNYSNSVSSRLGKIVAAKSAADKRLANTRQASVDGGGLLTSKSGIRNALRLVTSAAAGKRVILSAYVGSDPLAYIDDASDITIYCSDNPVGTHPDGVAALLRGRAKVFFVSRLHAKVYWSENAGCLIGSPNLSTNALGDGGLFETLYAVQDKIDITALVRSLTAHSRPNEVTPELLDTFRRKCRLVRGRVAALAVRKNGAAVPTFSEWTADRFRKPFSIVFWSMDDDSSLTRNERLAIDEFHAKHETGLQGEYIDYATFSAPVIDVPENEDLLYVHLDKNDKVLLSDTRWLRFELRTQTHVGRGGAGLRTRLFQIRKRIEAPPFQPNGMLLRDTLRSYFDNHPIKMLDSGVRFASGSRNERDLLAAAANVANRAK